ncbi:MAG TPA: hypothetical protein VGQ42_06770 [Candidatus Dormibacteraeota bacterium]|nr:hypothetical protein [Candidatus Dormibacteraeota bacterium]
MPVPAGAQTATASAAATATATPQPEISPPASPGSAPPQPTPTPVAVGEPWWVRVDFSGWRVTAVRASGGHIVVALQGSAAQESTDGGRSWRLTPDASALEPPPTSPWQVRGGRIGVLDSAGTWHADPGAPAVSPQRTAGHSRIAAPASLPGVVVAVDSDNVVWRRGADGKWARALLLLPDHIGTGVPPVAGLAAFGDQAVSNTVYMATDGYSVLLTLDGGDDWIRANAGLPDHVLAITTDASQRAVYAGTDDGLWVHHLQALPSPPVYPDAALRWRWAGIAAVSLAGAALSIGGLLRLLR